MKSLSRTAKLWQNLLDQIDHMLKFIFAEGTDRLDTTTEMLPYFHAAVHLPYTKSAHLYIQQTRHLDSKLTKEEYFTKNGFFTIRRKKSFHSGIWTDILYEINESSWRINSW